MLFFENKTRLRFAPSPTGLLHIGNFRSVLFGYLLAKSLRGKFILRIEDTDQKREVEGAVESLMNILDWVGIKFDEGPKVGGKYGPYIQTQRLDKYQKFSDKLLTEGKAYRCFCSEERLAEMREGQEAEKLPPRYDRYCRDLNPEEINKKMAAGEKFVIRQKMPLDGIISVYDELRGEIKFPAADLDDHVLIKSNGVPTYHFASVIDDHLMKISIVTRGDEWLPSYPKNILLYRAFNWTPPKFIHMPLILNKEGGGKLSKRKGDVFVEDYRAKGYLPEAIINFCALMGWHSKDDKELYTFQELKTAFSLAGMGSSPAVFDLEKLDFFNSHYIRQKSLKELAILCRPYLEKAGYQVDINQSEKFVSLAKERMKKLEDVVEMASFLFNLPEYDESLLNWKTLGLEETKKNLAEIIIELEKIAENEFSREKLENKINLWLKTNNKKVGDYLWPMRVALSGQKNSPSPFEIAWALGKEESLKRIRRAIS